MVTDLSNISTKFQVGAAACAIAGAALVTPGVANASPIASVPTAGLGSSAADLCEEGDSEGCESPFAAVSGANAVSEGPFQNSLVWFGAIPDNVPENIAVFEYNIIPLFGADIQTAAYSWWASVIPNGVNACILGATAKIDSYSTLTVGFTKGCSGTA
ncbi:hypothetical protein NGTWS1803_28560 [Mycolicibacterium cyprinidarum]|nr:hypothetical protein NGTWS1803_28560 [Mycolicibacterium sp. NGTWS1803]